jgi:hypothetical protein
MAVSEQGAGKSISIAIIALLISCFQAFYQKSGHQ